MSAVNLRTYLGDSAPSDAVEAAFLSHWVEWSTAYPALAGSDPVAMQTVAATFWTLGSIWTAELALSIARASALTQEADHA